MPVRLVGVNIRLGSQKTVSDVACGTAGPALILAQESGEAEMCRREADLTFPTRLVLTGRAGGVLDRYRMPTLWRQP